MVSKRLREVMGNVIQVTFGDGSTIKNQRTAHNNRTKAYEACVEGCRLDEDAGTLDKAEAAYRKALELDPTMTSAMINLGNLLFKRGELREAEKLFKQSLLIEPNSVWALYNLSYIVHGHGNVHEAITLLRKALESDPSFADVYYNIGILLVEDGYIAEGHKHLRKYLEFDPDSEWADSARLELQK